MLKVLRAKEREAGKDVRLKNELERSEHTTTEGSEDEHADDGRYVLYFVDSKLLVYRRDTCSQ